MSAPSLRTRSNDMPPRCPPARCAWSTRSCRTSCCPGCGCSPTAGSAASGEGTAEVGDQMTMETYLRLGYLVYSGVRGHPTSMVDTYLTEAKVPRRIEFTVESFLLAPFLLQGTDLVAVVPERAAGHLRRTADVRFLEPPMDLPPITE